MNCTDLTLVIEQREQVRSGLLIGRRAVRRLHGYGNAESGSSRTFPCRMGGMTTSWRPCHRLRLPAVQRLEFQWFAAIPFQKRYKPKLRPGQQQWFDGWSIRHAWRGSVAAQAASPGLDGAAPAPFKQRSTRVHQGAPQIVRLTSLVRASSAAEPHRFESCLSVCLSV